MLQVGAHLTATSNPGALSKQQCSHLQTFALKTYYFSIVLFVQYSEHTCISAIKRQFTTLYTLKPKKMSIKMLRVKLLSLMS